MALQVGVLGMGYMGILQAKLVKANFNSHLAGIVSRDEEETRRLGEELGCAVYGSVEDLLAQEDLDGLIVATPNHLHYDPVKLALANNVHVFVEKPMALRYQECVEMVDMARANQLILMVNHTMRFYEAMQKTFELVQKGKIGKPMVAHGERTGWEPLVKATSWKKDERLSGGHLFHHIHEIDLLLWFFGEVEEVFCYAENVAHAGFTNEDDVILVSLRFKNGALATLHMGGGFQFGDHFLRISGDQGGISISQKHASITVKQADGEEVHPMFSDEESQRSILALFQEKDLGVFYGNPKTQAPAYLHKALQAAVDHWIAVMNGSSSEPWLDAIMNGEAGRDAVRVAEAAFRSARTGQPVAVKDV